MLQNCKAKKMSFALKNEATYKTRILESHFNGLLLSIENQEVWVKFSGEFNAYNLLSIYAVALQLGLDKTRILTSMSTLQPVEGRLNVFHFENNIIGIVDYAHTPDALQNVIETILKVKTPSQKLITVIGCGGNRDKEKRPVMGKIAAHFSNLAIFTSDNPRNENPESILSDMKLNLDLADFKKILSISDRREAIMTAAKMANSKDIILLAGKGHEKYQEIKGEKIYFDDTEELKNAFKILNS
jgi:UDP-N-acetylmuramoyl-L-alanyl-D-glutamate--2,6-diaminopimelate ligase